MLTVLKKIALGLVLLAGAAAVLLYSDLDSRRVDTPGRGRALRVAVVQQVSVPALDDGVKGALEALKERGYSDGGRMMLKVYNAQGDISTGNAIAKEVTSSNFDLILTISTVSLQTVANANRFATPPRRHVFALVSDPYAAGVGVSRENHLVHPAYMTGVGSLAPVKTTFEMAQRMLPGLKRVGLVWDPSESNSVVTTKLAREVCAGMNMTLLEANADNSTQVGDAAASILARNAQAIWISPDLVAGHGIAVIVSKARAAGVPVFTSMPMSGDSGTLFELGADYPAIGRVAGNLAADVLDGRDTASIPVENVLPISMKIDKRALRGLREGWTLPDDVVAQADVVVDASGAHTRKVQAGKK